jgi:hypothetical protein
MPELALLALPVALGVAIAAVVVIVLRRSGVVADEHRSAVTARASVIGLADRAAIALEAVAGRVDQVRRGAIEAGAIGDELATATGTLGAMIEDGRDLALPTGIEPARAAIVAELERAVRAIGMVEHGRAIQAAARGRGREVEAQTAVKRGYLNLLHARESILAQRAWADRWLSDAELRARRRSVGG